MVNRHQPIRKSLDPIRYNGQLSSSTAVPGRGSFVCQTRGCVVFCFPIFDRSWKGKGEDLSEASQELSGKKVRTEPGC